MNWLDRLCLCVGGIGTVIALLRPNGPAPEWFMWITGLSLGLGLQAFLESLVQKSVHETDYRP